QCRFDACRGGLQQIAAVREARPAARHRPRLCVRHTTPHRAAREASAGSDSAALYALHPVLPAPAPAAIASVGSWLI
ncbi:hypothetical protein ABTC38_18450, partial [Acinetobacter baumannii]